MVPLSTLIQLVGVLLILASAYAIAGWAGVGLAVGLGLYTMGNELASVPPGPPRGQP